MSAPASAPRDDDLDAAVDEALQLCGGDARLAIRGLIAAQRIIERQVSTGYVRRRLQ
jgi:hypothetical protein